MVSEIYNHGNVKMSDEKRTRLVVG